MFQANTYECFAFSKRYPKGSSFLSTRPNIIKQDVAEHMPTSLGINYTYFQLKPKCLQFSILDVVFAELDGAVAKLDGKGGYTGRQVAKLDIQLLYTSTHQQ